MIELGNIGAHVKEEYGWGSYLKLVEAAITLVGSFAGTKFGLLKRWF